MPVIVVGADTPLGRRIVDGLLPRQREVRAFVTDPEAGSDLKAAGVKVAVGDVSDSSHIGSAALHSFSAVLVGDAASDGRERSFTADLDGTLAAWAEALTEAEVQRVILVGAEDVLGAGAVIATAIPEYVAVATEGRRSEVIAKEVAALDDAADL